ncbi:hypothetical protein [Falsiroseomonas ponticola]|uniref:hypothetical protein n=1 Tax=Falsiroseomonas ponticola TaxID=2786951 RepID=UPI001933AD18|nr:hypothetical protein [Roseomonas ponticola]
MPVSKLGYLLLGGATFGALLLGGGAVLPDLTAQATSQARSAMRGATNGWDVAACQADAVGCLEYQQAKLRRSEAAVEAGLQPLAVAAREVQSLIVREEAKASRAEMFLHEGRRLLLANATTPQAPIAYVGVTLPGSASLERQMQLTWTERDGVLAFLDNARAQRAAIIARHDELLVARGEVRAQLAILPAQIELARTAGVMGQVEAALRGIDAAVARNERGVASAEALIRTTEELVRAQAAERPRGPLARDAARPAGFEAFLRAQGS